MRLLTTIAKNLKESVRFDAFKRLLCIKLLTIDNNYTRKPLY